jgi:hypothetical protein
MYPTAKAFVGVLLKHHANLHRHEPKADLEDWKMTYGELCQEAGMGCPSGAGWFLGHIHARCKENHLAPLNALVVNAESREPGDNYPERDKWKAHIRKCIVETYPAVSDKMWD